jgi:1-phosphatidylinositol phosphodiesterase
MKSYLSKFPVIVALLTALAGGFPGKAAARDLNTGLSRWMYYISNSSSLGSLTIPGSHDSGALYERISGTAICQNLSIGDQLNIGVRYLDIRLRQYGNGLLVHHGSVYQHQDFNDVLAQVTAFLATNPSETVVMEVSSEYTSANSTETYEQTFMRYVNNSAYSGYWWRDSYVPALGEVRGKIVLLRRFSGSIAVSGGIDITGWQDNAEFTLADTRNVSIVVQDYYKVKVNANTNSNKWGAIIGVFSQASSDTSGTLYLNYTSGFRSVLGVPNITAISSEVNSWLYNYFAGTTPYRTHYGVVISDFVNEQTIQQELRAFFYWRCPELSCRL